MRLVPVVVLLAGLALSPASFAQAATAPRFRVDPFWPKPLPNNWIIGQAAGVAVDAADNVWVVHRPGSLTPDEQWLSARPPVAKCCRSAPPVLQFSPAGEILRAWGGPGQGYDWPANEHGIYVDPDGFVWLAGNGAADGQLLKFTADGKFVLQIGRPGANFDSNDTTRLGRPAGMMVDPAAHEIYVADGYSNRRVIVFDTRTGAYKRHWGAYGQKPVDGPMPAYTPDGSPSRQFGLVHCVRLAEDGLVYVCDRTNDRIQVFTKDGAFVREIFVAKETLNQGSVWDLYLWPDRQQSLLLNADGANNEVRAIDRQSGAVIGSFGRNGRQAGQFHWVHNLAIDSKGAVFTTEVDTGKRVQRFTPSTPPSR